jgi:histidinol-phosphate aminotransferase
MSLRSGSKRDLSLLQRLVRHDLEALRTYQPIRLAGAVEGDTAGQDGRIIKLDGNENVYGCSPRVREALGSFDRYHIYPDAQQQALRQALADYVGVGVGPDNLVAGSGSDEIVDLLLRLVIEPGDAIVIAPPTFGFYTFSGQVAGATVVEVPRGNTYGLDVPAVFAAIEAGAKVVFIDSPNNPTGIVTPLDDVLRLLDSEAIVVLDEAYYEFCGTTLVDLVPERDNLVVLRTFSKWAGLAGLRLGYGVMAPELASRLMSIKPPYNVNAAAEVAALESLEDIEYLMGTVRSLKAERERLYERLRSITYLEPVPSEANFILCHLSGRDAKSLHHELRGRGIYLRHFDTPLLKNCIRISVGKPEDTDAVIEALRDWE